MWDAGGAGVGAAVAEPSPPRGHRWNRGLLIGGVALLLAGGGGIGWFVHSQASASDAVAQGTAAPSTSAVGGAAARSNPPLAGGAAVPSSPAASSEPTATASATQDPQAAAIATLNELRQQSLARLQLDGRWVAQVASKVPGITDPYQTAANGTHTFYATDILAESEAARSTVTDPSEVLVLLSTDFGKSSVAPDGQPYWITVVDGGFTSADDVGNWCAQTYASLSPAALADTCAPRTLVPSHP